MLSVSQCRFSTGVSLALILVLTVAGGATSAPTLISYQGRLTNPDGSPVGNSTYQLQFAIYEDSVGGQSLWSETASITTSNGLFSHLMGSVSEMPSTLFHTGETRYLEISAGGETIIERARLGTVPFAMVARDLFATDDNDSLAIASFSDERRLVLFDAAGKEQAVLQTDPDSGGQLILNRPDGEVGIGLHGGISGDSSVTLPDSSVSSTELLNETGQVTYINVSPVTLVTLEMTDMVALEIETPADGYIVLEGKCYVELSGTTGPNVALVQIDQEEGGGSQFPYYTLAGLGGYATTSESYFPVYVTRVYWKQQGIHEFRMEGRANHPPPAEVRSWDHVLTATYCPTSYGVVSKVGLSPEGHPDAVPIDIIDPQNPTGPSRYYQMDLRYFEQHGREIDTPADPYRE